MNQIVTDVSAIKKALQEKALQSVFGHIVGISQPIVSEYQKNGVLTPGATYDVWLKEYCLHLRNMAAGRAENNDELRAATIREKTAKARQAEIATAKELDQLVRVEALKEKLTLVFSHLSSVLVNSETSIREQIKLDYGIDLPTGMIAKYHDAALSEIANFVRPE